MQHANEEKASSAFRRAIQTIVGDVIVDGDPIIDGDKPQFETDRVFPAIHHKQGKFWWDIEQQANALLKVDGLTHGELARVMGLAVLNANFLDCLLERPYLIPNEWDGKIIHFLGTRYQDLDDSSGYLLIRSMYQREGSKEWSWEYNICDDDLCCLDGYVALAAVSKKT